MDRRLSQRRLRHELHTYSVPISELLGHASWSRCRWRFCPWCCRRAVAIPVGVYSGFQARQDRRRAFMGVARGRRCDPEFLAWPAFVILLFALQLGWFPLRVCRLGRRFLEWHPLAVLPALALALPLAAILARVTRSAVIETLGEDFVRTARQGPERAGGALAPCRAQCADPGRHHYWPAILLSAGGNHHHRKCLQSARSRRLVFQAIAQRDLVTVQSLVTLLAASVIGVNFIVDLVYGFIDPAFRREAADERSAGSPRNRVVQSGAAEPQSVDRLTHHDHSGSDGRRLYVWTPYSPTAMNFP